jgi:hypothetical protein
MKVKLIWIPISYPSFSLIDVVPVVPYAPIIQGFHITIRGPHSMEGLINRCNPTKTNSREVGILAITLIR